MVIECENPTDLEIIVGTYEEFVLGYKPLKTEDGVSLSQSFANHSHRASVRCVAGGGRFLASGGADDLIQLYDMKLRKEMGVLMHHDKTVTCLVFVGQSHLASGSSDGELALWRTGSWQCEKVFKAHPEGGVCAIAVHPSGKLCLTAGNDKKLRTWSLVKGRAAYTVNLHAAGEALCWSPSGDHYAVLKLFKGGAEFSVDVYAVSSAAVVYSIKPENKPSSICFMQDDVVAVGTIVGSIEFHSVASTALLCTLETQDSRIRCIDGVRFPTGVTWLVTATSTGDITVWKYKERGPIASGRMEIPIKLGHVRTGCRVTSLTLVVAPLGAVACKTESSPIEVKEEIKVVPKATLKRERVIVELEDSSEQEEEEEQQIVVKKIKKVSKLKKKGVKHSIESTKKVKTGIAKKKKKKAVEK